ncbi:MAG TPA: efflux RND transporter periplasmic adaptor subunit [Thermoanaerobaculia bacterium]|nr:efflux RND transporter periplasmic adaptor subunit [Thermoanaerobaculia bacterium]
MMRPSAALLLPLLLTACGVGEEAPAGLPVPLVEAVPARSGGLPQSERVSGRVKAENQVSIRAEVESPIVEVYVRSGQQVAKGDPLVRHRDDELRQQLGQAAANVRLAEAVAREAQARVGELESRVSRARALSAEKLISAAELETLEAQLAGARAVADQAVARIAQARATEHERRAALANATVRAPVSGWVGQRNAEVGMLPGRDTLLFVLGDIRHLIVETPLTEEMVGRIGKGDPVLISSPVLGGNPVRAAVSRISPFLESGAFSTIAEIDVPNPDGRLRPGMFVTVDVLYGESEPATLIPMSALWEDPADGREGVFVLGEGESGDPPTRPVAHRSVEVVGRGQGMAGVRGIEPGEWVVTSGQHLLARDEAKRARVRPATWERVVQLQTLQREDLVREFLATQQQIARTKGAVPPDSTEYLRGAAR